MKVLQGRFLWIDDRSDRCRDTLGPESRRTHTRNMNIHVFGRFEERVRVRIRALRHATIDPYRERGTKRCSRLCGGTDEIGNRKMTCLHDPVAKPPEPPRVCDPVLHTEAELTVYILSH